MIQVVTSVLQCIAILLTIFRLWYRVSIRRFWWEDAWAAVAMICAIISLASYWVHLKARMCQPAIVAYWVYTFAFPCVVWAVRMSVLYSVTRLVHPLKSSRRITRAVTFLFVLLWSGVVFWKAGLCGSNLSWYDSPTHSCSNLMPHSMAYSEFATDVISDAILIALPFRMLWEVKLPENRQRKMILAIFSSSIIVTLASLFRAVCRLMRLTSLTVTATDFEALCNLLVVVTYFYRVLRKSESEEEGRESHSNDESPAHSSPVFAVQYLTTIDLDNLDGYESGTQVETRIGVSKASQPLDHAHGDVAPVLPDILSIHMPTKSK
ncbi:hypothetical protein BV22DRAFT_1017927 [Leucogyrophana mollusca]|uniref:Uncharacterized protein n=1 Tax=Leucogyrophana mollusca TaxID=85980 RepID=A0ACB8B9Z5_9AGAM|nr:hypothetical protein BV22DRAFT_1017927 [Leucogyrophana mollusca]